MLKKQKVQIFQIRESHFFIILTAFFGDRTDNRMHAEIILRCNYIANKRSDQ